MPPKPKAQPKAKAPTPTPEARSTPSSVRPDTRSVPKKVMDPIAAGHHWTRFTYLTLAAVVVVLIGLTIVAFAWPEGEAKPANTQNTNTTQTALPQNPTLPDLAGGNRFDLGHYYPVAVMIDNAAPARPQSGLQAAAVVYEALVEGGITRFMAVYDHGEVSQIGPVRSARPYFLQWLAEYDAAYAHAGGSPEALGDIRAARVHDINGIGNAAKAFYRERSRPAPHNLYTSSSALYISTVANKLKISDIDVVPWTFASTLPTAPAAKTATKVSMYFSGRAKSVLVEYVYDQKLQRYIRSQAGQPHQDQLTKSPIRVTNLIIQTISSSISVGEKGRLGMTVTGTGKARLFQQGQVREVTWTKKDREARTLYTYADGSPVTFLPGNTWVEVLPADRTVTVE